MHTSVGRALAVLLGGLLGFAPQLHAHAQEHGLYAARAKHGQIRVDGDLGEWRGVRSLRIGEDANGSIEARLAYDDAGLYVGARVQDDTFVRSAQPSPREDALVLALALPNDGHVRTSELWLFAGEIGRSRAALMLADGVGAVPHALAAPAQVVEGPLAEGSASGYVIEAFVPWASLPGGADHGFARAVLRLHDVDRAGGVAHDIASSSQKRPEQWPWLELDGGTAASIASFLQAKNLASATPKLDWVGDLRGDARAERVIVVGTYVLLTGNDAQFSIQDLAVSSAADVRSAALLDLDGDAKPELVLTLRQRNDLGTRELWQAFTLQDERPRACFAIETRKETSDGFVNASVNVKPNARTKKPEIETQTGEAHGSSANTLTDSAEAGVESILLPWGPVSQRSYAWDGAHFAVVNERKNPKAASPTPRAAAVDSTQVETVEHAEPPGTEALVAAYKNARGVPSSAAPRFKQSVNVAEDARIESLLVFGSELVVVGEGFRGGLGFFYFGLPVKSADDVQRVFTGDVTGDGRREVFVRVRQTLGEVQREILLGYTFTGEALTPILSVEVRRTRGSDSVGNVVKLVRDAKHFALRIEPGLASGWSATTYPFTTDSTDGIGPLLLPWKDGPLQYRYDGQVLAVPGAVHR